MMKGLRRGLLSAGTVTALAGCGGGSAGTGVVSTPVPPPSISTPLAEPSPPFKVTTNTTLALVGDGITIRWNAAAKAYDVDFAGQPTERLAVKYAYPHFETHEGKSQGIHLLKNLPYQYTSVGSRYDVKTDQVLANFAYGIPTAANDVPKSGSASYEATLHGEGAAGQGGYYVQGSAELIFNFGAGELSGFLHPKISDAWFEYDLGRYDFTQTVYAAGSTNFSGRLLHPETKSSADSGFTGIFTGPNAAELMAAWHVPFKDPNTELQSILSGVLVGRKK